MSAKVQTVHVRVNDAATGKPTPCRVRFTDLHGDYYAPFGRLRDFAAESSVEVGGNVKIDGRAWAYLDGTCEIALPPGEIRVQISKGPEYRPVDAQVTLAPGKLSLRLSLERWIDLRAEGWYSGDTHCYFLSPNAALLEGAAEDLAVVNLLAWECAARDRRDGSRALPNLLEFSGQRPAAELPGHLVAVNTRNSHPVLGDLFLLNCHRVVYPLTFGGPGGVDEWTLMDWCDQCHRKGGLVLGGPYPRNSSGYDYGELLPNLIAGRIDGWGPCSFDYPWLDPDPANPSCLDEWYRLLNAGFRIPLVTGSGKTCNFDVLGSARTYARLGADEPLTYQGWIEAVRAGRTFVTNGPLLTLLVNGQPPGAVVDVSRSAPVVRVRAEARSLLPLQKVEIIVNNRIVTEDASLIEAEVPLDRGGWVVARCYGDYDDAQEQWVAAQTSPVYVTVDGRERAPDPAALDALDAKLRVMLDWVGREGRFEDDKQRQRLAGVFEEARRLLLRNRP